MDVVCGRTDVHTRALTHSGRHPDEVWHYTPRPARPDTCIHDMRSSTITMSRISHVHSRMRSQRVPGADLLSLPHQLHVPPNPNTSPTQPWHFESCCCCRCACCAMWLCMCTLPAHCAHPPCERSAVPSLVENVDLHGTVPLLPALEGSCSSNNAHMH